MPKPPLAADRVAELERLVRTTTLPMRVIAQQRGVSPSTLSRYARDFGWTRPDGAPKLVRPPSADADRADVATLAREGLVQLNEQLSALRRDHARLRPGTFQATLRAIAETTRTLKELARVAASWTPAAPAPGSPADELDDERFAALCDDLALAYERWQGRQPGHVPPGGPDAPSSP